MIQLPNPGLPAGELKSLKEWQKLVDDAGGYAAQVAEAKRLFPLRNVRSNAVFQVVKQRLTQMCSGVRRCVYCEDSLADEVEHVRPKDLYPEMVFRWENYVYACGPCNGPKNNQFAVLDATTGQRVRVTRKPKAPVMPPTPGEPALVNPRDEDPMELLQLDLVDTFMIVPKRGLDARQTARAEYTWELLFRDRDDLPLTHRAAYNDFLAHLRAYTQRRLAGAPPSELGSLKREILNRRNPTVWREMQRQPDSRPDLRAAFDAEPEALTW